MKPNFEGALEQLTRVRGVRGAVVVDAQDGIALAGALRDGEDGDALAALAGAVMMRLVRGSDAAGLGPARLVYLRGDDGLLCAAPFGGTLLIAVLADRSANLGLVRLALLDAVGGLAA